MAFIPAYYNLRSLKQRRMTTIATTSLTSTTGSIVRNNGIVSLFRYQ